MTPTHEQLAWAREAHGCVFGDIGVAGPTVAMNPWLKVSHGSSCRGTHEGETGDDGYVGKWCETHARMPCRLGEQLAQRVAERDQRIKAEARNRGRRCGCAWCCSDVPPDRRGSGHKECS